MVDIETGQAALAKYGITAEMIDGVLHLRDRHDIPLQISCRWFVPLAFPSIPENKVFARLVSPVMAQIRIDGQAFDLAQGSRKPDMMVAE